MRWAIGIAAGVLACAQAGFAGEAPPLPSTLAVTATPSVDPRAPCGSGPYRQFDFWLGDWRVFDGKSGQLVATDHVDAPYGHCVIRQRMRFVGMTYRHPGTPFALAGTSISRFDGQQWVQLWADNQWGAIVLKGTQQTDGSIALDSAFPSRGRDMRLVWHPVADGVRIEQAGAHAGSGVWERYEDLVYRRVPVEKARHARHR